MYLSSKLFLQGDITMSQSILQEISEEFSNESFFHDELGMEGRISLNFMAVKFNEVIRDFGRYAKEKLAFKKEQQGSLFSYVDKSQKRMVDKRLDLTPYSSMDSYTIRCPAGVVGPMLPYANAVLHALLVMEDVDTRLIKPIMEWAGHALSSEDGPRDYIFRDMKAFSAKEKEVIASINALKTHFDEKISDGMSFNKMITVYPTRKHFDETAVVIDKMAEVVARIVARDIPTKAEECSKLVTRLVDYNDREGILKNAPKHVIFALTVGIKQAAMEMEALATLIYQAKQISVAYNESMDKIKAEL